jgi:hypothetical protein
MKWKNFLRPSLVKIILVIILLGLSYFYVRLEYYYGGGSILFHGLPFPYYQCTTSCLPNSPCSTHCDFNIGPDIFPFLWLVVDVIILYLVSCLMVWIYNKVKK